MAGAGALALSAEPEFVLQPGGALDLRDASIEIHPTALAGAGLDGNPLTAADAEPDAYLRLLAGLDLRAAVGDASRLSLAGEAEARRWMSTEGRDGAAGEARASWTTRDEGWWWRAGAALRYDDTPLAALPVQAGYRLAQAGVAAGGESRSWAWQAAATALDLRYREDPAGFQADLQARRRMASDVGLSRLAGGGSQIGIGIGAGSVLVPEGAAASSGHGVWLAARWRHALATRSWISLEGGPELWRWRAPTAQDDANDDERLLVPRWRASLAWEPEQMSGASLAIGQRLEDGSAANAAEVIYASGDMRLRVLDRTWAYGDGQWQVRTDSGAPPGAETQVMRLLAFDTGIIHRWRDGLALRVHGGYERSDARIGDSWAGWRAATEIAVAF